MISAWLGRTPPTHVAHAIHRETEGNPFFIEEVLRHLIDVAAADRSEWERLASFSKLGIPDGVREAIERRLARLSAEARRIVTMAAAIGRSFSIAVLDDLAEVSGERLLAALEEAAERRIVEEEAGPPGRYAFAHALIRETLYASLSGPRRVSLHRRIGAIIEERHGGDPDPPLGELAYHSSKRQGPERRPRPSTTRRALGVGRWQRWRTRKLPATSPSRSRPSSCPSRLTKRPAAT
jgi:predicted ATPase